jgi:hypothetical protein
MKLISLPLSLHLAETAAGPISFVGADLLYDELRVPNIHKWEVGKGIEVTLRPRQQWRTANSPWSRDAKDWDDVLLREIECQ